MQNGNDIITGQDRIRFIEGTAAQCIRDGFLKGGTIERMKQANAEYCTPKLLVRDMPIYYANALARVQQRKNELIGGMEDDAVDVALDTTDPEQVAQVIDLARELYDLQRKIEATEEALAPLKKRHAELSTATLPEAMKASGVGDEFPLANGWRVKRRAELTARLPTPAGIARTRDPDQREAMQERLDAAIEFLVETGNQGIVKDKFEVALRKGETNRAKGIENFFRKRDIPFLRSKTVAPQTLSAFVREMVSEGRDIPFDIFGVYEVATVKLIAPKE